jgi:hypothetical protein
VLQVARTFETGKIYNPMSKQIENIDIGEIGIVHWIKDHTFRYQAKAKIIKINAKTLMVKLLEYTDLAIDPDGKLNACAPCYAIGDKITIDRHGRPYNRFEKI